MLYVSTWTIKALYSLLSFLIERDHLFLMESHCSSCFLLITSSTSPSNEPSSRVCRHSLLSRVLLLLMLVCSYYLHLHEPVDVNVHVFKYEVRLCVCGGVYTYVFHDSLMVAATTPALIYGPRFYQRHNTCTRRAYQLHGHVRNFI